MLLFEDGLEEGLELVTLLDECRWKHGIEQLSARVHRDVAIGEKARSDFPSRRRSAQSC